MRNKIKNFACEIGIKECGFCKIDGRTYLVCLFPYYLKGEEGNISMYARGRDYHLVIREKLDKINEFLGQEGEILADIGTQDDRKAAFLSGLGFYGKNGLLINPRLGTYFFIGQLEIHAEITPDSPLDESCMNCGACKKSCPGGALREYFNISNCASEISQKKGDLTEAEIEILKKSGLIWGCDICQSVCPHNKGLETTAMAEFMTDRIAVFKDFNLSNREFLKKYKTYAFSWRGLSPIKRNAELLGADNEEK